MALSGYIIDSSYNHTTGKDTFFKLSWTRTSYSYADNTSTISWTFEAAAAVPWSSSSTATVVIAGKTYKVEGLSSLNVVTQTLKTGTEIIQHQSDGSATFNYSFEGPKPIASWAQLKASGTGILDSLMHPPAIYCTNVNIGSAPIITIKKDTNEFQQYEITYGFGNQELGYITGTIANTTTATKIDSFVWPQSFYQVIPNSTSGTGTLFCKTYDKFYQFVGETTYTFTATANYSASTPTISPIIKDSNTTTIALTGDSNKLVRYFSTASITINAEAKNYATIASQKAKCGTAYFTTPTGAIGNIQSEHFSFEAIDSRGYKTSVGRNLKTAGRFIEYYLPTCTIENNTIDTAGNTTVGCFGTWFNGSFGAVNNTLTAQYRYKVKDGSWSSWQPMTVASSVATDEVEYTATADLSGLDYRNTYVFEARVTDKLTTVTSSESSAVSLPVFHWSKEDFVFEVPVTFKKGTTGGGEGETIEDDVNVKGDLTVDGGATIKGDLRLKGDGNYGNSIYFGDSSYVSFTEATDDDLTIKATDINFNGSNINLDTTNLMLRSKKIDFGGWTPKLDNSAAVSSYSTQYGWYQQLGNVITVGWQIKATINSGYQGSLIKIVGLPFSPAHSASGGGLCSGAYVSAGFNFQCWVADTYSAITARVQSCNNTSAANLSTSSSGLYYRTGGGEMTLSGTITFLIY